MRIPSRVVLAFVTFAVALPMAFGQAAVTAQAAAPANVNHHPQFQHQSRHHRQVNRRGQWNRAQNFRASRNHRNHGMHRQFMLAQLVKSQVFRERIGISTEQAQKIETETFNFRKAMIDNRAALKVKHLELGQLFAAETPNRSAIDQKLQEISLARLAQSKAIVDFRLDMRAALTQEQRQKMQQMRRDFQHHGFGPHGPGAPGADVHSPATEG